MANIEIKVPARKPSRAVRCRTQKKQEANAVFLTQPEATREGSILKLSTPSPPPEDDLEQEKGKKLDVDEIKKRLYQRECTRLGVTPVGAFMREPTRPELAIRHYSLGPRGAKALSVPLMLDSTLTSLDLEGNAIGADGLAEMVEMLTDNCSITHLNLKRNNLRSRGASLITRVLVANRHIVSLNLAANAFVDKDGVLIADMLKENRTLKVLDLSDNSLSFLSGKALGEVLSQNESIETLDLSWNQFRESGAVQLLQGVKENVSLKTLTLAYNACCSGACGRPVDTLSPLLSGNETLAHLDLFDNRLSDPDIFNLAKGLRDNERLQTLRVGQNFVTVQGTSVLIKSVLLNEASGLQLLDLADLPIGDDDIDDVDTLQERGCVVIHGFVHQQETDFESEPRKTGEGNGEEEADVDETQMEELFPEAGGSGGKTDEEHERTNSEGESEETAKEEVDLESAGSEDGRGEQVLNVNESDDGNKETGNETGNDEKEKAEDECEEEDGEAERVRSSTSRNETASRGGENAAMMPSSDLADEREAVIQRADVEDDKRIKPDDENCSANEAPSGNEKDGNGTEENESGHSANKENSKESEEDEGTGGNVELPEGS